MLKTKTIEAIKNLCSAYINSINDGYIMPLYIDGGNVEFDAFTGSSKELGGVYKLVSKYIHKGEQFIRTVSTNIYHDDFENPYMIFPIEYYETFYNPDVIDLRKTFFTEPVGMHLTNTEIFDPQQTFIKNMINILLAHGKKFEFDSDVSKDILAIQNKKFNDEINRRIKLLKGKISNAKRTIKDPEKLELRINTIKDEIENLRLQRPSKKSDQSSVEITNEESVVINMAKDIIKSPGYLSIYELIISQNIKSFIDKNLVDKISKKLTTDHVKDIKKFKMDFNDFIEKISFGYDIGSSILPDDDAEIRLYCKKYFMIKASEVENFHDEIFGG